MYGARVSSTHSDDSDGSDNYVLMNDKQMNMMPKREMKLVLHMCEKEGDDDKK